MGAVWKERVGRIGGDGAEGDERWEMSLEEGKVRIPRGVGIGVGGYFRLLRRKVGGWFM